MKKLLSIALTVVLMLSLSVPAFAEVTVDGETITETTTTTTGITVEVNGENAVATGNPGCVSAEAGKGKTDPVKLEVTGNVTGDGSHNSVYAAGGGEITVGGGVTAELDWPGSAIQASNAKVTVKGAVTEKTNGNAINASFGAAVEAGSVDEKNAGDAINATNGTGTTVTVNGDVTEKGDGHAIDVKGSGTKITVKGSVTEEDNGDAIYAQKGATVKVYGNVEENGEGGAINTGNAGGVTVIVGGDVTENGDGKNIAVLVNGENTKVIIEGTVDVDGYVGATNSGELYLGKLERAGQGIGGTDNIHYLIGFADNKLLQYIGYKDPSSILEYKEEGIEGAKKDYYFVTKTADAEKLEENFVTLMPNESNKILKVSGFGDAKVKPTENADGSVTIKILSGFNGGLQNLVLVLEDKTSPSSEPVYYIVPLGSVTTASVKLPAGVAEGLIKALDSADRAGLTVDSSLVGDGSVKVLKDGKELNAKDFSTYTHADGSIDVIMSNTYLFALGSGSYDFTAIVGGLEIPFTVVVAK